MVSYANPAVEQENESIDRYAAIVIAARRLLAADGIDPDDAPYDVWKGACDAARRHLREA